MPKIEFKIVAPKKMNLKIIQPIAELVLKQEAKVIIANYRKVSSGFFHAVRYRTTGPRRIAGHLTITVSTTDKRMVYLDKGTKERWAVMSNPFVPKTRKRYLGHQPGQGKAVIRGRRAMQARGIAARPGIKAREFTKEIAKVEKNLFRSAITRGMAQIAKRIF